MPEGKGLIKVPGSFTFLPDFFFSLGFSTLVSLFVPFKTGHDLRVALRTVLLSGAGSNCIGSSHETELPHILRHARSVQLAASEGLILAVRQGTSSPSVKVLVSPRRATWSVLCLRTPKETPLLLLALLLALPLLLTLQKLVLLLPFGDRSHQLFADRATITELDPCIFNLYLGGHPRQEIEALPLAESGNAPPLLSLWPESGPSLS